MNSETIHGWGRRPAAPTYLAAMRWLVLSGFLGTLGCGNGHDDGFDRIAVAGSVLLDGQPLPAGKIRFIPFANTDGPKTTLSITQGHFQGTAGDGPCVGRHRVEIELNSDDRYAHDDEQALDRLAAQPAHRINHVRLPAIYNERSTLTAIIDKNSRAPLEFKLNSQ